MYAASLHAGRGFAVGQEPGQRFGHRLDERDVIVRRDQVLGKEPERAAERRALGLVSRVAVHGLPRHERALRLGEPEEALAIQVPLGAELGLLDRRKRGLLGAVIGVEAARLVPVPAPCGAVDGGPVGYAEIGG